VESTNVAACRLARELGVSDTTIRKVRRGEILARRRNDVARRTPLLLYILTGARVEEGCGIYGVHLELASHPGRVHIAGTKSDAGDRKLPLLPALREALLAHRADFPFDHREPVLMTRNGRRNTPNNITDTILAPTVERANELLEADGLPGIARLTMHSLRRTFASILAVCEVPEKRTITLLGHNDIKLTQSVYQQDLDLSDESIDALERVMGCTLDEAYDLFGGRLGRARRSRVR
jgi:integrase